MLQKDKKAPAGADGDPRRLKVLFFNNRVMMPAAYLENNFEEVCALVEEKLGCDSLHIAGPKKGKVLLAPRSA